jgi:hypothetical protein
VRPIDIDGLLYIPSEIELIDIYHMIYNPVYEKEIDDSKSLEKKLFKKVEERKTQGILGARDCKAKKRNIEIIKIELVKEFLQGRSDIVLIGSWAYDWVSYGEKLCVDPEKIQIISGIHPDQLLTELKKYTRKFTQFDISYKEQSLKIPKDFRTKRYTFYINTETFKGVTNKPFMDMFNSSSFNIIPYHQLDNMCIGSKYVILRFLLIDLWILRIIRSMDLIQKTKLQQKINHIWKLLQFFQKDSYQDNIDGYSGTYRNYNMDKKINNMKNQMFYPYYPYIFHKDKNEFRQI